jgi:hypothetical protein
VGKDYKTIDKIDARYADVRVSISAYSEYADDRQRIAGWECANERRRLAGEECADE